MKVTLKDGKLWDEHGREVGRVLKLELDLHETPADPAGDGQAQLPIAVDGLGGQISEVWEHYVRLMKPRHTDLDPEGRAIIRAALKVADVGECKLAITGCWNSDFHMKRGEYAARKAGRYNKLSQVLKGKRGGRTTREQIDFFIDIARRSPGGSAGSSGDQVRIRDAKNEVLAAHEFPDDEHTRLRGVEARQWLAGQGWTIGARPDDGWPTFTPPQE